jgi:hypothetical protein
MRTGILARRSCILALCCAAIGTAQAQHAFAVAGPLHLYVDLFNPTQSAASFAAIIDYNPDLLPASSATTEVYEEVIFNEAVTQVEFAIFDNLGNELVRRVEEGISPLGKTTYIRAVNDLVDGQGDELEYNAYSEDEIHLGMVAVIFSESTGSLFSALTSVPEPPALGDVDSTAVSFLFFEYLDGITLSAGFRAEGTVTLIDSGAAADPFEQCMTQARNHGQYVSCVSHINNALRVNNELTGRDTGRRQQDAASSKN